MAKLLVGAPLSGLYKTQALQMTNNFLWLKDGQTAHSYPPLCDRKLLSANKLCFERRLAVFKKHGNDFLKMLMQLIKCHPLRMCTGEAGDVTDIESRFSALFNNGGKGLHDAPLCAWEYTSA